MDIKQVVQTIEDELAVERAKVRTATGDLYNRKKALDLREKELEDVFQTLKERDTDLNKRESKIAGIENSQAEAERLKELTIANDTSYIKARTQEARLVEIKAGLDRREAEVIAREQAVSVREETYKEKLKKDFLEELQKKLT